MEIKTTKEIGKDYNYSTIDHSERIKKKWVSISDLDKYFGSVMNVRNGEKEMRRMIIDLQIKLRDEVIKW